jgi:hypothetical protein
MSSVRVLMHTSDKSKRLSETEHAITPTVVG